MRTYFRKCLASPKNLRLNELLALDLQKDDEDALLLLHSIPSSFANYHKYWMHPD
jgi:hypothetical protein